MHMAALGGHAEIIEFLLSSGADANVTAGAKTTPLNFAAREGHVDIVKRLLWRGAAIESRSDKHNRTPLMEAAENGHASVVAVLLRHGADQKARASSTIRRSTLPRRPGGSRSPNYFEGTAPLIDGGLIDGQRRLRSKRTV